MLNKAYLHVSSDNDNDLGRTHLTQDSLHPQKKSNFASSLRYHHREYTFAFQCFGKRGVTHFQDKTE